eukprot:223375-Pyramimonas_sp.AAC.1
MALIDTNYAKISWDDDASSVAWWAKTDQVNGTVFVLLDKTDKGMAKFLNNSFSMVDALAHQRDLATDGLMEAASKHESSGDSLEQSSSVETPVKRARRELFDYIDPFTEVSITTEGGQQHKVRVKTSAQHRHKLWIKLTQANMSLLAMTPAAVTEKPVVPDVPFEHVSWLPSRQSVRTTYYCGTKGRWITKSTHVPAGLNHQDRVIEAAQELEAYFAKHHCEPPQ